ncbi:MAG: phosphatase, partial [Cytophagales bacterium]|nr:phosphatase [Cytophagales bacterium]
MRIAVLDLGTNTFHLIIADSSEKGYDIVRRKRVFMQIGRGIEDGYFTSQCELRILSVISEFSRQMREEGVEYSLAVGTSAFRRAENAFQILDRILESTGIRVEIISGAEEAVLIYEGVRFGGLLGEGLSLLMDIGGGSTEFIIGNREGFFWRESFEM